MLLYLWAAATAARCGDSGAAVRAAPRSRAASLLRTMSLFFKFRSSSRGAAPAPCGMECGVFERAPPAAPAPAALSPTERSPAKAGLHVNFSDKGELVKERREKFLTAKYGSHQMALIRKRLAVEMWLYDELQKLYDPKTTEGKAGAGASRGENEVEVDIDELLDMDGDEPRRTHLARLLVDAKKPQKDVHKFINELLEKAKTL